MRRYTVDEYLEDFFWTGSRDELKCSMAVQSGQTSRQADKQESRKAGKQESRKTEKQKSRKADKQKSRKAANQLCDLTS
jgi:hypothetical protein